jgi:hypothetical protein
LSGAVSFSQVIGARAWPEFASRSVGVDGLISTAPPGRTDRKMGSNVNSITSTTYSSPSMQVHHAAGGTLVRF